MIFSALQKLPGLLMPCCVVPPTDILLSAIHLAASKGAWPAGIQRGRRFSCPTPLVRPSFSPAFSLGAPSTGVMCTCLSESRGDHGDAPRAGVLSLRWRAGRVGLVQPKGGAPGRPWSSFRYLRGGYKKSGEGLFARECKFISFSFFFSFSLSALYIQQTRFLSHVPTMSSTECFLKQVIFPHVS